MVLIFVFFTIVGVAMVIWGEGVDRVVGVVALLMFGLGGVGWFAGQRRRADVAVRVGDIVHHGHPARALIVPARLAKWLPLTLGSVGLGAGCLLLGVFAAELTEAGVSPLFLRLIGFGGGALFLFVGAGSLAGTSGGPPKLALLPDGVVMTAGFGRSFVSWDLVTDVGVYELGVPGGNQRFVGLRVTDPSRIEIPRWLRGLGRANRGMSGWDLTYPESLFDLTADQLAQLLAMLLEQSSLRRAAERLTPSAYSFDELLDGLGHREG